jgi:WD40 repeat protein
LVGVGSFLDSNPHNHPIALAFLQPGTVQTLSFQTFPWILTNTSSYSFSDHSLTGSSRKSRPFVNPSNAQTWSIFGNLVSFRLMISLIHPIAQISVIFRLVNQSQSKHSKILQNDWPIINQSKLPELISVTGKMSLTPIHTYVGAPNCERGRSTVLGVCPKGETIAYGCGNNLILRNIKDPLKVDWYTAHAATVTVAKWAPSGYYIASADASGVVRIWSTDNTDKTLKLETKQLSNVRDLAWASDSLRVVIAGEGKEAFAAVFLFDTGSSVGSIGGHSKQILSVDHSPKRPHVIVTGGEDFYVNFYKGPPFKTLDQSNRDTHNKYVNCVRWAPSGDQFCSASSDKTVVFYDGKTGQKTSVLDKFGAHSGTIFSCAWNPESSKLLTSSGDKTAKIWDTNGKTIIKTITIGAAIEDQQVCSVWPTSDIALSVSLNGTINYLAPNDDSTAPVS